MSVPLPRTEFRPPTAGAEVANPWSVRHGMLLALLGLAIGGDFANFYITLSVVANQFPVITVLVVLALTAAAVGLAHSVGVLLRQRQQGSRMGGVAVLATMAGSWALLGLSVALVRWFSPVTGGAAGAEAQFGDPTGASVQGTLGVVEVHRLTSLLLLALYVASGVLAAWIGYLDHDPERRAARGAWRRLVWTGYRARRDQASVVRAETALQRLLDERQRLTANQLAVLADRDAAAEGLKAYARLMIAVSLGDPVATDTLTAPAPGRWPTTTAPRPSR